MEKVGLEPFQLSQCEIWLGLLSIDYQICTLIRKNFLKSSLDISIARSPSLFGDEEHADDIGHANNIVAVDLDSFGSALVRTPTRQPFATVRKQNHVSFIGS